MGREYVREDKIMKKVSAIVIVMCIISTLLVGCGDFSDTWTVETKRIVDYRYVEQYTEIYTGFERKYDFRKDDWVTFPVTKTNIVKAHYELLWEYTYADGHTERCWEECTRFEYENAKKELGDVDET